jgi:hypothetical protein
MVEYDHMVGVERFEPVKGRAQYQGAIISFYGQHSFTGICDTLEEVGEELGDRIDYLEGRDRGYLKKRMHDFDSRISLFDAELVPHRDHVRLTPDELSVVKESMINYEFKPVGSLS